MTKKEQFNQFDESFNSKVFSDDFKPILVSTLIQDCIENVKSLEKEFPDYKEMLWQSIVHLSHAYGLILNIESLQNGNI